MAATAMSEAAMEEKWFVRFRKPGGELRRQFSMWKIPKPVLNSYSLADGDDAEVILRTGREHFRVQIRLTSGDEFRLRNSVAHWLQSVAEKSPDSGVGFELIADLKTLEQNLSNEVAIAASLPIVEIQSRLDAANRVPKRIKVTSVAFLRNPDVVAFVLRRANGICEDCGSPAPFHRCSDGTPYLEIHHRKRLADGGEDVVSNAVALCPNCHRRAHFG